jgi:hypothetical protein
VISFWGGSSLYEQLYHLQMKFVSSFPVFIPFISVFLPFCAGLDYSMVNRNDNKEHSCLVSDFRETTS